MRSGFLFQVVSSRDKMNYYHYFCLDKIFRPSRFKILFQHTHSASHRTARLEWVFCFYVKFIILIHNKFKIIL